jgi:hypothetical protein
MRGEPTEGWRLAYLTAPEGEDEATFWHRKFGEAAKAIALVNQEKDKLAEDNDKLRWMLDTFMHQRHDRMNHRAGYADIFALVKQDLADDYDATRCSLCGRENDNEDPDTPCMSCRVDAAEYMMEDR